MSRPSYMNERAPVPFHAIDDGAFRAIHAEARRLWLAAQPPPDLDEQIDGALREVSAAVQAATRLDYSERPNAQARRMASDRVDDAMDAARDALRSLVRRALDHGLSEVGHVERLG